MSADVIPVVVLGGYLGSGKTSIVRYLLSNAGRRFAVIVNDLGSISLDDDLVSTQETSLTMLSNGCACCDPGGGLPLALFDIKSAVAAGVTFDFVVIEANGLADVRSVAGYAMTPGFRLHSIVVVVDATRIDELLVDPNIGPQIEAQLHAADLLVVSKLDLAELPTSALQGRRWVPAINGVIDVNLLDSPSQHVPYGADVDVDYVADIGDGAGGGDGAGSGESTMLESTSQHFSHVVVQEFESTSAVDEGELIRTLGMIESIRVKGIVRTTERSVTLNGVGSRLNVSLTITSEGFDESPAMSRLVIFSSRQTSVTAATAIESLRFRLIDRPPSRQ